MPIQYTEMDLRNKTTSEFRTVFHSPLLSLIFRFHCSYIYLIHNPRHSNSGQKSIKYDYLTALCVLSALYTIINILLWYRGQKTKNIHIFMNYCFNHILLIQNSSACAHNTVCDVTRNTRLGWSIHTEDIIFTNTFQKAAAPRPC